MKLFGVHSRILDILARYSKESLSADTMAGIIVGIVALPLAIAFAIASGVSPEKGIITAVIAGFIISVLVVVKCKSVVLLVLSSLLFMALFMTMASMDLW